MNELTGFIIMLSVCVAGWKLGQAIKLPAAPMLGAMIAVTAASVLSANLHLPGIVRSASSIGVGMAVGCRFNLKIDRGMIWHILAFVGFIFLVSLALGFILMAFGIDKHTAIFSGMLGGITEISLIALEFEAITYQVSLFHMVRVITLMLIVPAIAGRLPAPEIGVKALTVTGKMERKNWVVMASMSIAAGLLGGFFQIPAGRMVGAMAVSAAYSKKNNVNPRMNRTLHNFLQCIVGGAIGLGVTPESVVQIRNLIIPLIVLDALVLLECFAHTRLMCRLAKWDKLTSLLACTPGGLGPCVLLSVEMGADHSVVTMYQVIRYLSVILLAVVLGSFMGL